MTLDLLLEVRRTTLNEPYYEGVADITQCPLCKATDLTLKFSGSKTSFQPDPEQAYRCTTMSRARPEILQCGGCGHQFSNPQDWPDDLIDHYADLSDHDYLDLVEIKRKTFRRAANVVERFSPPPGRLLEVGCYAGLFMQECVSRGYDVEGVEPSLWGSEYARSNGLIVHTGAAEMWLDDESLGSYDAVVSWDVLEHVHDPAGFIAGMSERCRDSGIVMVSTLDRSNWFARITGRKWPWLIPMHLHYFDRNTVKALGERAGLEFLATMPHVHYASARYALNRLVRNGAQLETTTHLSFLDRLVLPVAFGDVRTFVFRKVPT